MVNGDNLSSAGIWMGWFRVIWSSTNGMAGALTGQTYTAVCNMNVRCGSAALGAGVVRVLWMAVMSEVRAQLWGRYADAPVVSMFAAMIGTPVHSWRECFIT
jgi:hypothetical protein